MPIMRLNDADIYYESTGSDKPPLVFIHGFTCDHRDWDSQVKRLSGTNRVITCDLRGQGQSTGGKPDCTIEDLAQDTVGLINSLDLRNVVLIGHSMGCRVALETYMRNPQLIAGIILVEGSQMGTGNPRDAIETTRNTIQKIGYPSYVTSLFENMFFGNYDVSMKNRIIEGALRMNPKFAISLRSNLSGWDAAKMETALSELKIPLLIIQSTGLNASNERFSLEKCDITPYLDLVRRLVPSAKIEVLPGHGHFIMLEAPDATSELIASFTALLKKI